MSTKSSYFLTAEDEHVYRETNDDSIVLEIHRSSILSLQYKIYDKSKNEASWIVIDDFKWLEIETRPHYSFSDLMKLQVYMDYAISVKPTTLYKNQIYLSMKEIKDVELSNDFKIKPWNIFVTIDPKSEWFREYHKELRSSLEYDMKNCAKKMDRGICLHG